MVELTTCVTWAFVINVVFIVSIFALALWIASDLELEYSILQYLLRRNTERRRIRDLIEYRQERRSVDVSSGM